MSDISLELQKKITRLKSFLAKQDRVIVALSGGVDSSLLAKIVFDVLGANALAVTGQSATNKKCELKAASNVAREIAMPHEFVETKELEDLEFIKNGKDRCFICKLALFKAIQEVADREGVHCIVEGSNKDDLLEFRPGMQAVKQSGIQQPLLEAGLTKQEIRQLAKHYKLTIWNKPSSPCLATRIPYYSMVTLEKLKQIELGEAFLAAKGLSYVRLRHHGDIARIEVARKDFNGVLNSASETVDYLKTLGFTYITLDVEGFRTGSMDEN